MLKKRTPIDKRLLGSWRSDRRRTMESWRWRRRATARQRDRLAALFGHLTLRFTARRLRVEYQGHHWLRPYEILGADSDSVAIRTFSGWIDEPRIIHIRFDGASHISLPIELFEYQREWFRRMGPRKRGQPRRKKA